MKYLFLFFVILSLIFQLNAVLTNNEFDFIHIEIVVPENFKFNTFNIISNKGILTNNQSSDYIISISNLNVNSCLAGSSFKVDLSLISLSQINTICTLSNVYLKNMIMNSTDNNSINISSNNSYISFKIGSLYNGSFNVQSINSFPNIVGDCIKNFNSFSSNGTCSNSNNNNINIMSTNSITIQFGGLLQCDKDAVDVIPIMENFVANNQRGSTFYNLTNADLWKTVTVAYGQMRNCTETEIAPISHQSGQYWSTPWYLVLREGNFLPSQLRKDTQYKFSFSIKLGNDSGYDANSNNSVSIYILPNKLSYINGYLNDQRLRVSSSDLELSIANYKGALNNITLDWKLVEFTFYPDNFSQDPMIAIEFSEGQEGWFYFKDISIQILPKTIPNLLLSKKSEVVEIPTMENYTPVNNRINCPHIQNDIEHWADPTIWANNELPTHESDVVIPSNTKVLISSCSINPNFIFKSVTIPIGSELIFNDANINFNVREMNVYGSLKIGSPDCRIYSYINITFHGTKSQNTTKGIFVDKSGNIDIHGKEYNPTWTRLALSAVKEDDRIYLLDNVNWEAGQEIVVITSYYEDEYFNQNEIRKIKSVKDNVIVLDKPLKYFHYAGTEYQSEVGLLSRRIKIQGNEESVNEQYGGHVMVTGQGRFSGVESYRMGQKNILARYPFHFHLMKVAPHSFVKDSSIHNSFFRCVAIHGSHNITLSKNVGFDITGHCYYLEDGVEENNTIEYNLAAFVHVIGDPITSDGAQFSPNLYETPERINPADAAASGFYLTNAYNIIRGNAASGGWAGFAFINLPDAIGLHREEKLHPDGRPTLVFDGNTVHSSGYYWPFRAACIYIGGKLEYENNLLKYQGGRISRETRWQIEGETAFWQSPVEYFNITNVKSWLCSQSINHWGNRVEFRKGEIYETGRGLTLFGRVYVNEILFSNSQNPIQYPDNRQAFQFYDQWVQTILHNVTFRGYKGKNLPTDSSFFSNNMISCLPGISQGISASKGLIFQDGDDAIRFQGELNEETRFINVVDWDGSLVGENKPKIIGSHPNWWNIGTDCYYKPEWVVWICDKTDEREIANVEFLVPSYMEEPVNDDIKGVASLFGLDVNGKARSVNISRGLTSFTGITGEGWYVNLIPGTPKKFIVKPNRIPLHTPVYIALDYPSGTTFTVKYNRYNGDTESVECSKVNSFLDLKNSNGTSYYFNNQHLMLKVMDIGGLKSGNLDDAFIRGGVSLYDIDGFIQEFDVTASCTEVSTNFCSVSKVHPQSIKTIT